MGSQFMRPVSDPRTSANGDVFEEVFGDEEQPTRFLSVSDKHRPVSFGDAGDPVARKEPFQGQISGGVYETGGEYRVYAPAKKNGKAAVCHVTAAAKDLRRAAGILVAAGLDPAEHLPAAASYTFGTGARPMADRVREYLSAGGVTPADEFPKAPKVPAPGGTVEVKVRIAHETYTDDLGGQEGVRVGRYESTERLYPGAHLPEGVVVSGERRGINYVYRVRPRTKAENLRREADELASKLSGHAREMMGGEEAGEIERKVNQLRQEAKAAETPEELEWQAALLEKELSCSVVRRAMGGEEAGEIERKVNQLRQEAEAKRRG